MKITKLILTLLACCTVCITSAQTIITNKNLRIEVNDGLQTKVNYDLGYDPETHCIQNRDTFYFAFFNPDFNGIIELRGLNEPQKYRVVDYANNKDLGTINGNNPN